MGDPDDLSDLTFGLDDNVAVITLCRPERRNAFTGAMGASLGAAYRRCDEDDRVRAVVVTGAGDVFCAGADLDPAGETFAAPATDRAEFTSSPVRPPAWEVRKPVLAAVNAFRHRDRHDARHAMRSPNHGNGSEIRVRPRPARRDP